MIFHELFNDKINKNSFVDINGSFAVGNKQRDREILTL